MLAGPFNGFSPMSSGADRNRVALAMFENNQSLGRAFGEFDRVGLPSDQMGLAGRASAIAAFQQYLEGNQTRSASAQQLIRAVEPLGGSVGDERVFASSGSLWPALRCFGTVPGDALITACWLARRYRDEIAASITHGAVLFGLRATSVNQQKTCTQILLQHSSHRVHTHEFNL
jgi:hypothetical protein